MDEKMKFEQGQLVIAHDEFNGGYIGLVDSKHRLLSSAVNVKILACTSYPLQRTVFYAQVTYEREPYDFGSVHAFDIANVKAFEGSIPDYDDSVRIALDKAIEKARVNGDLNILIVLRRHALCNV